MREIVQIGGKGVEMLATASTPIRLKQVFGIDYFSVVTKKVDDSTAIDLYSRLGYIMAKQAEGADFSTVTAAAYLDWLDQFEPLDMVLAVEGISGLYDKQAEATSVPKKG